MICKRRLLRVFLGSTGWLVFLGLLGVVLGTSPAGAEFFAYVTSYGSYTVAAIDTETNTVVASIPTLASLKADPYGVAITPDGTRAYVTHSQNFNRVTVIATATNTVIAIIPVTQSATGSTGFPSAMTPDGTRAYAVSPVQGKGVAVIDTAPGVFDLPHHYRHRPGEGVWRGDYPG